MYDASATTTLVARAESDRDRRVEHVDVVEIEDALIGWTRDGTVPDGGMLSDARLRIAHGDVADVIQKALDSSYDLVLLDVDNGPGHLVYADNGGARPARDDAGDIRECHRTRDRRPGR